jgi:hypothetical protein
MRRKGRVDCLRRLMIGRLVSLCMCVLLLSALCVCQQQPESTALIVPGQSVGSLRLGDSRQRLEQLFPPKKNIDQQWEAGDRCGTTYNWVDLDTSKAGNVFVHLKDGTVFQIDSATERFHTPEGIAVGASPEQVRKKYARLRAYILSSDTSEAQGMRPLVYWIDSERGLAFAFAYSRAKKSRYLYRIIASRPGSEVCPLDEPDDPSQKRELPPYSLEAPDSR